MEGGLVPLPPDVIPPLPPSQPPLELKVPPSWTECTGATSLWDLHMEQLSVPSQYRPLSTPVDVER